MTKHKHGRHTDVRDGTAGQRRAAARAERLRKKRRQTYYITGVIVVAVAVVLVMVVWASRPLNTTVPDVGHYADLPVSVTEDGLYHLGAADAPVLMKEFSSFACSACAAFHDTVIDLIDPYIKDGTLAVEFAPIPNSEVAYLAASASLCAGQQDPIKFWEMHDVLFAWRGQQYNIRHVEDAAKQLGLDAGDLRDCVNANETTDLLQAVGDEAALRSIGGTPAAFFNGQRPNCGDPANPNCEGNLPYSIVEQNIQQQLANLGLTEEADEE